ncbi:hypothetical protein Trydic_g4313 [Trypoxylus dichotomus]
MGILTLVQIWGELSTVYPTPDKNCPGILVVLSNITPQTPTNVKGLVPRALNLSAFLLYVNRGNTYKHSISIGHGWAQDCLNENQHTDNIK